MSKRKGRVRVFMHDLWWTDKLKVVVPVPQRLLGKRNKVKRRIFADGVAAGVVAALEGLEVEARAKVLMDGKQVND